MLIEILGYSVLSKFQQELSKKILFLTCRLILSIA